MNKILLGLFVLLVGHLLLVAFTHLSLVGYWTDAFIPLIIIIFSLIIYKKIKNRKMNGGRISSLFLSLITISYLVLGIQQFRKLGGYQFLNSFQITTFHWLKIDNRFYNAYFVPVGSYSGGEGEFWVTQSSSVFPILEEKIFYKHAVLWNFSLGEWDGQEIDQEKIVRDYLQTEILDKKQGN